MARFEAVFSERWPFFLNVQKPDASRSPVGDHLGLGLRWFFLNAGRFFSERSEAGRIPEPGGGLSRARFDVFSERGTFFLDATHSATGFPVYGAPEAPRHRRPEACGGLSPARFEVVFF